MVFERLLGSEEDDAAVVDDEDLLAVVRPRLIELVEVDLHGRHAERAALAFDGAREVIARFAAHRADAVEAARPSGGGIAKVRAIREADVHEAERLIPIARRPREPGS